MEELKLNQTPIRTSKNYNINNIKLKNVKIPKEIGEFKTVNLSGMSPNIEMTNKANNMELKYGVGIVNKPNVEFKIDINKSLTEKLAFNFKIDNQNENLVENIFINAKPDTEGTIILKYETEEAVKGFHNGTIKLNVGKNSKLNVILVNLVNEQTNNFLSIESNLEENANLKYTIIDFGGKNSITNYYTKLSGKKANSEINTIYLGRNNQTLDLNYIGELYGEKSNLNIDVQGAIKDNAKKHFKGTIDFKKGCKKAKGNENEYCTILSDTAKSLALPMLLCDEEDVEGNHASSAGKIGEKELFYIMSRGFKLKEALKLMVIAKFNKVLETIENEELKEQIISEIETILN